MNKNLHISFSLLLFKMYGWVYERTYVCRIQWMSEWNEWMNMILRTRLQIIQMNWRPIWKRFPIVVFNSLIVPKYNRFQFVSFREMNKKLKIIQDLKCNTNSLFKVNKYFHTIKLHCFWLKEQKPDCVDSFHPPTRLSQYTLNDYRE